MKKIFFTPEMQQAYLNFITKGSSAGYVNPEIKANQNLSTMSNVENKRLFRAGEAGKDIKFMSNVFDKKMQYQNALFGLKRNELESRKKAQPIVQALGLAKLGLGFLDYRKTEKEAMLTKKDFQERLKMQLDYLKKYNPEQYLWYVSQPYIQTKLKKSNLYGGM